jgi:hypothetical protein
VTLFYFGSAVLSAAVARRVLPPRSAFAFYFALPPISLVGLWLVVVLCCRCRGWSHCEESELDFVGSALTRRPVHLSQLLDRLTLVSPFPLHSNIDCLTSQLRAHGSFMDLFWYRGEMTKVCALLRACLLISAPCCAVASVLAFNCPSVRSCFHGARALGFHLPRVLLRPLPYESAVLTPLSLVSPHSCWTAA